MSLKNYLPPLVLEWLSIIVPALQVLLIVLVTWLLQRLVRRLMRRLSITYSFPPELTVAARRIPAFLIYGSALLLILERLGVSGEVLWTAFTGFAAVGAVAFFAAWSVLSNIFCTLLIVTTRPFRLHDYIELLEGGDRAGLRGQVVDINLIYTTLAEPVAAHSIDKSHGPVLQIPNSLFFQRTVRRWPRSTAVPWSVTPANVADDNSG